MAELPWLPLPPGEARCCFLGTRKLAPTLQIMINMLLNGIIVLSNCEMLSVIGVSIIGINSVNIFIHLTYQFGRLGASSVDRGGLGASSDTWIRFKIYAVGILS